MAARTTETVTLTATETAAASPPTAATAFEARRRILSAAPSASKGRGWAATPRSWMPGARASDDLRPAAAAAPALGGGSGGHGGRRPQLSYKKCRIKRGGHGGRRRQLSYGKCRIKMLHILRMGPSASRICSCDPTGITSDGVEDLSRIKGFCTAAHFTASGQSISCEL